MSNYKKIKRNRNIFGRNFGLSAGAVIVWTLLIIFFVGLGWFLYDPIYKLVTEGPQKTEPDPITYTNEDQEDITPMEINKEDTSNNEPINTIQKNTTCSYIPSNILLNHDKLVAHLDSINKDKINSVMIDLKDINGNILYKTSLDGINETRIVASNAVDLNETISLINQKGFCVTGRIYSFKDHVAPLIFRDMSVKYMDTNMLWLDNTKENGGKPWLNPYSDKAQEYILNIAKEAYSFGITQIIFDGVQFPSVRSAVANYGKISKTNSQTLSDFAQKADKLANESKNKAYIAVNASAIFASNKIYGGNPLDFAKYGVALNLQPSLFVNGFKLSDNVILENPSSTPGLTVETVLSMIKDNLDKDKTIAILGGGNNDQLAEQIEKTNAFGINDYIAVMA